LTPAACHGKEPAIQPAIYRTWDGFMSKEKRGTKRLCESCENKFYDLGKTPIICPVCEAPFVEEKPKPKPKAAAPADDKAAEPAPVAEKEKVPAPAVKTASEVPDPDPEFVSLEEAAAEENVDEDAKLADLGDDEEDIPPDENQDVFLEEDDDEAGSEVSGIIGGAPDTKD